MRKFASMLSAATIALGMSGGAVVSANAAPFVSPSSIAANAGLPGSAAGQVQQINHRRYYRSGSIMGPGWGGRSSIGEPRYYVRRGTPYYNGHRGYRTYRHGYRRHKNFWFPAGAFVAGAIIGSTVIAPRYYEPPRRHHRARSNAHIRYCYDRYRLYRIWDNTFKPYHGPRRQCRSPYGY